MPAYAGIQSPGVPRLDSRSRIKYGTSFAGMTLGYRNWQCVYEMDI
jgi:hypothetical protein